MSREAESPVRPDLCVALFLVPCAAGALAEGAPDAGAARYAEGAALLRQGRVDEAAKDFLAAARAEPQNAVYVQQALVLGAYRGSGGSSRRTSCRPRWETSARSLHLFYLQSGLGSLAVELDTVAHQRMQNATSATWLAEAYLETGRNAEATTLLATFSGQSPQLAAYHALALARLGQARRRAAHRGRGDRRRGRRARLPVRRGPPARHARRAGPRPSRCSRRASSARRPRSCPS